MKELLTIFIGIVIVGDNVNRKNLLVCSLRFSGITLYKCIFYTGKNYEELSERKYLNLKHDRDYAEIAMIDVDDKNYFSINIVHKTEKIYSS